MRAGSRRRRRFACDAYRARVAGRLAWKSASSAVPDGGRGGWGCAIDSQQSEISRVITALITRLRRRGSVGLRTRISADAHHASRNVAAIATRARLRARHVPTLIALRWQSASDIVA